ncbi:molybdopterin molybdotransferase MoeA [Halothiobacillus sp. DCM-1]|uniref:molybdopterin molybdotransferase MoeA n=1 Tax=Halothiobacillus sp. DCM-1 TaxID=3112558 RepID=UPI0032481E16
MNPLTDPRPPYPVIDPCHASQADPTLTEALDRLLACVQPTPVETVALRAARDRCLAAPLTAPTPFPPFSRAMMDGYALRAAEVQPGARWIVQRELIAGQAANSPLPPGHAVRIATGAALPEGADTVLRQEWAQRQGHTLRASLPQLPPGKDAEAVGSVTARGAPLLPAHTPLTPTHLAQAARHGIHALPVHRTAAIALILIGNELIPAGQPLPAGHLYEHNAIWIESSLDQRHLGRIIHHARVDDDPTRIHHTLTTALAKQPDLVILVGGTSVGSHDFTRRVLQRTGRLLFEGIQTRPGRTAFAAQSASGHLVIALPGSPKAVHALFDELVVPTLCALQGQRIITA